MVRGESIVKIVGAIVRGKGASYLLLLTTYLLPLTSYLYLRLEPSTRCTTQIALQAEHGPAVFPSDRSEGDRAANGVEVHHEQRPPLSALILDDTALMDVGAGRFVLIHLGNAELRAVMSDAVLLAPRHLSQ